MVVDENNGEQKLTHKAEKLPDRNWNVSAKKNINNNVTRNSSIQSRREPSAKFGAIPTKILGRVRITEVGDRPFEVDNSKAHLDLGILV